MKSPISRQGSSPHPRMDISFPDLDGRPDGSLGQVTCRREDDSAESWEGLEPGDVIDHALVFFRSRTYASGLRLDYDVIVWLCLSYVVNMYLSRARGVRVPQFRAGWVFTLL